MALLFGQSRRRETWNSDGMSPNAGILYIPGPRVYKLPSGE